MSREETHILLILCVNISTTIHMIEKTQKNMHQQTMNMWCVHFGKHLPMDTLTLAPLCLRIEHIYSDAENMPLETSVILLEYPE